MSRHTPGPWRLLPEGALYARAVARQAGLYDTQDQLDTAVAANEALLRCAPLLCDVLHDIRDLSTDPVARHRAASALVLLRI